MLRSIVILYAFTALFISVAPVMAQTKSDVALETSKSNPADRDKDKETADQRNTGANIYDRLSNKENQTANGLLVSARNVLQSDPNAPIDLAMKAFSISVPVLAPEFLVALASHDRAAANKLFSHSIDRIVNDESAPPEQLVLLSAFAFGKDNVVVVDSEIALVWAYTPPKDFTVDPVQVQQLFNAGITVLTRTSALDPALSTETASRVAVGLFLARLLQPKIAQFQPALADEWGVLTSQLDAEVSEKVRKGIEDNIKALERPNAPASNTTRKSDLP